MKHKSTILLLVLLFAVKVSAVESKLFVDNWLFKLADSTGMSLPDYKDSSWRKLTLPHDWAIEGDFLATNPSGESGGALPGGIGWYRKHFDINDYSKAKRYYIDFDGVYMNSTVYVNGIELGTRPYGYSSFRYDITKYVRKNGNVVAVRVDNSDQPNSRWYSGCGIYRNVYLVETGNIHVAHWGTFVTASQNGDVNIDVSIDNTCNASEKITVRNSVVDSHGRIISVASSASLAKGDTVTVNTQHLSISNPSLWSVDSPNMYLLRTELLRGKKVFDTYTTKFGFRSFKFEAASGFWLNGKNMKINGVCDHHDLGCLGAAIHKDAIIRKLSILKEMGCNAIRCSHNPPAPELLDACDSLGFIVMDESFDMWHQKKTKNDYARFFDKWFERDLTDLVVRDRNHPSVIMWSIGNEVLEQWNSASADKLTPEQANLILNASHDASSLGGKELSINSKLTRRLVDIVKHLDSTRPVTSGCNEPSPDNNLFKSGALDIIGYNYHIGNIKDVPHNFPGKPFIMTESVSALQTRGNYIMPSDTIYKAPKEWWLPYTDPSFMCSAYDNMHASWSSTHEQTWDVVKNTPFVSGQFIWTGWDYIGEPTPYRFPARSSYFGIIDLAGFPKDIYYMYQSEWTSKPVLHLFPHWNWIPGQTIDMWCYYNNADDVELFVNNVSQGVRHKQPHEYHVMWRVKFEPGEVRVVARKNGNIVREQTIHTAGTPDHIRLTADRSSNTHGGLVFVKAEIVDKDGNLCPGADNQIFFNVNGEASIAGVDNGSQTSMERFKANNRKAFFGRCMIVLRTSNTSGEIKLTGKAVDLKDGYIKINNISY
jgi:Beta-galactosidase/beta-glucuronidase